MRFAPLGLALMLCLNGCAVPTAVTIASFAADGVSYIATGKSTTDHALSMIAQEDCAMARALAEQPICVSGLKGAIQTAALAPKANAPAQSGPKKIPANTAPITPATDEPVFVLIHKDSMKDPRTPAPPRLVAKATVSPLATTDTLQLVEKSVLRKIDPAQLLVEIDRISPPQCGERSGLAPAGQCRLGPDV